MYEMRISVFSPVKNEVEFAGYSIMAALPFVHEILYGVAKSEDGTEDLLMHVKRRYAGDKLRLFFGGSNEPEWDFNPLDMKAYNDSYNFLIQQATGDALWFLHPDMIITNAERMTLREDGPLAWYTHITSYARDAHTEIVSGRGRAWKNIHANKFGLHYYGAYGSQNEDMYFKDITGSAYRHHGMEFENYPFEIADSGIHVNHYCEVKSYKRRLEKMKLVLKTLHPKSDDRWIEERASQHPRVTLESTTDRFGQFAFEPSALPVPDVFNKYRTEFDQYKVGALHLQEV
jgi:hypothetical protein